MYWDIKTKTALHNYEIIKMFLWEELYNLLNNSNVINCAEIN